MTDPYIFVPNSLDQFLLAEILRSLGALRFAFVVELFIEFLLTLLFFEFTLFLVLGMLGVGTLSLGTSATAS
jgi:hypothetical protein